MILTKPHEIDWVRLLYIRYGLRLEIAGMKSRGRSAYSVAKEEFNLSPYCFSIINNDVRYDESKNIKFLEN